MTPEEFQARFGPYAQQVSQRTGLDPRLVLSQAALETGWGSSAPNNNFFGIKSHGQAGGNTLMTQEFEDGQMVNVPQSFRGYESPEQSFRGYADFILSNPRYQGVLAQGDLSGQIAAMGQSGYATDPDYTNKLASISRRLGGDVQISTRGGDTPAAVATDTRAALGFPQQNRGSAMMPPRERPQGLLQTLGIQRQGSGGPEDDKPFYQRDRFADAMGALAMGANTLRANPDQNVPAVVSQAKGQREAGRTAEWLGQQEGGAEFAQMIASGGNPAEVLMAYRQSRQPAQTFRQVRGSDIGMTGESADALFNVGPDGKITGIGGGGTNITNVMGGDAGAYLYGTDAGVPAGWRVNRETGEASPIPGGPIDVDQQALAGKEGAAAESSAAGSVNVLEVLDTLKGDIEANPNTTTGFVGSMLSGVAGTGAYNAEAAARTVKANLAFDALSQMRAESPTGGALGSVSAPELALLESAIASLDLGQSPERIMGNIERIEREYKRILEKAYETGDPARLDAVFGGRPNFLGSGSSGGGNTLTFNPETGAFE